MPTWLRQRWGVRAASALSAAMFVAISLAGAGLALVLLQDRAVRAAVEDQVQAHAALVADRLATGETAAQAVAGGSTGFAVVQVLGADGSVLAASPQLLGAPALRPVEAIRSQIAALSDRDRGRRVTEPVERDEIGRLARTMNDMLARLEAARTAQRRFVADAGHELRSPLATITARLELGQRRGASDGDIAVMMPRRSRMNRLIEDLLLLARADERGLVPRRDDVDLDELAEAEVTRLRGAGRVDVRAETAPVRVTGDRAQLARVMRNLVDNAARHAAGYVVVTVRAEAGGADVEVLDDGPGIPVEERRRVFERFVRLDDDRAREAGGAGLGLAIVAEVVTAHGGWVEAGAADSGGCRMQVSLPAQVVPDGATDPAPGPAGSPSRMR